jgi:hypothetical protein
MISAASLNCNPREHNEDNYQSHESKWVACHSLRQHSWFYFFCQHPPKHATLRGHPRADISGTKPHPSFGNTNKNWQELMQEKKADVILNETCQNCVYFPHISKIQYCTMQLQVQSKTHSYSARKPSIPPEPVVCLERQNRQCIIQCLDALNQHWKGSLFSTSICMVTEPPLSPPLNGPSQASPTPSRSNTCDCSLHNKIHASNMV